MFLLLIAKKQLHGSGHQERDENDATGGGDHRGNLSLRIPWIPR